MTEPSTQAAHRAPDLPIPLPSGSTWPPVAGRPVGPAWGPMPGLSDVETNTLQELRRIASADDGEATPRSAWFDDAVEQHASDRYFDPDRRAQQTVTDDGDEQARSAHDHYMAALSPTEREIWTRGYGTGQDDGYCDGQEAGFVSGWRQALFDFTVVAAIAVLVAFASGFVSLHWFGTEIRMTLDAAPSILQLASTGALLAVPMGTCSSMAQAAAWPASSYRACELCDHSTRCADARLHCQSRAVTGHAAAAPVDVARARGPHGACGPDARHLQFAGLA